jgi:single-stranded DNA-binding protein
MYLSIQLDYNKVTLVGRIGADPICKEFKGGNETYWSFPMVTKKSIKDLQTNEWNETLTWHSIKTTRNMKGIGQG